MHFREALAKVCEEAVRPNGAFMTYSKLCDMCGNHYESVRKISLFYKVDSKLDVAHRIKSGGREAVSDILASYQTVENVLDEDSFRKMINAVAEVILDGKTEVDSKSKIAASPKAQPVKPAPAPKAKKHPSGNGGAPAKAAPAPTPAPAQKAKINRAPQPAKPAAAPRNAVAPNNAPPQYYSNSSIDLGDMIKFTVLLIIPILLGLFIPLTTLPVWAKWLIGIVGAILTGLFVLCIPLAFDSEDAVSFCLAIPLIISGLRFIRAGSDYAIIAGCVSVVMFLVGLYHGLTYSGRCFSGMISLLESFLSLVMFLFAISFSIASQWIIGIMFSAILVYAIYDAYSRGVRMNLLIEFGFPAVAMAVTLVVNLLLVIFLTEYHDVTFRIVSAACAILSGYHIYRCFDDDEIGFGVVSIVNCVAGVAGFVLAFFLL